LEFILGLHSIDIIDVVNRFLLFFQVFINHLLFFLSGLIIKTMVALGRGNPR
jgi:hypothetical protein